jgi:hypothetical protein
MNEQDIIDLLHRMSDDSMIYDEQNKWHTSEGSISWNALRQAEKLNDTSLIQPLVKLLKVTKEKEIRKHIYFILCHIGLNTQDVNVADILVDRLLSEQDKYVLSSLLDYIAEQPAVTHCSPITNFLDDKRWLVRQSAIIALGSCKSDKTEQDLLVSLQNPVDEKDLPYIIYSINKIHSKKAIPYLSPLINHKTVDVRCLAISALSVLGDSSLVPVFLEGLKDKSAIVKGYAMSALVKHGDETVVEPIIDRVKNILARKRQIEQLPKSDLIEGMEFLNRYRTENIQVFFEWIKTKKREYLFDSEICWLRANIPSFEFM